MFEILIKGLGRDTVNDNLSVGLFPKSAAKLGNRNCLMIKKTDLVVNPPSPLFSACSSSAIPSERLKAAPYPTGAGR